MLFGKRRAYQRKVAVADFDGLCSSDILVFEPADDQLLPELLPFIVQTEGFFQHALGTSAGSLSPRTRWRDLAAYEFPLPPLDEQRRIAEILWAAEEALNSRVVQKLFPDTRVFWQVLLRMDHPGPNRHSESRARQSVQMSAGCRTVVAFQPDYQSPGVKLLRPGNLGRMVTSAGEDATDVCRTAIWNLQSAYMVRPGDVLINLTAQSLEDGFMGSRVSC